eukprot:363673-Chlamydomonas_euryale.AAC.1
MSDPELYLDAQYEYDPWLLRRAPPPVPDFERRLGRADGGADSTGGAAYDVRKGLDYHVEDVPLSVLAEHRSAPRARDMGMAPPRFPPPGAIDADGSRLSLAPEAADRKVRREPPRPPDFARAVSPGRHGGGGDGGSDDEAAFRGPGALSPARADRATMRRVGDVGLPDMGRAPARPPLLPPVTAAGDLDAGVYAPRFGAVRASAPAADFSAAAERETLPWPARDIDDGNVLALEPRHVQGWSPPRSRSPGVQPFGRRRVRWADDPDAGGADECNDGGQVLLLRPYAKDDLAALGRRPTARSARNAAPWGKLTAPRGAAVLQPCDEPQLCGGGGGGGVAG